MTCFNLWYCIPLVHVLGFEGFDSKLVASSPFFQALPSPDDSRIWKWDNKERKRFIKKNHDRNDSWAWRFQDSLKDWTLTLLTPWLKHIEVTLNSENIWFRAIPAASWSRSCQSFPTFAAKSGCGPSEVTKDLCDLGNVYSAAKSHMKAHCDSMLSCRKLHDKTYNERHFRVIQIWHVWKSRRSPDKESSNKATRLDNHVEYCEE